MTIEAMREELISEYPGVKWRIKVLGMPNAQVVKIYGDIQERKAKKQRLPKAPYGEQLSMFSDRGRLLFK